MFLLSPQCGMDNNQSLILLDLTDEIPGYDIDEASDESDIDSADNFYSSAEDSDCVAPPSEPPPRPPVRCFVIIITLCSCDATYLMILILL